MSYVHKKKSARDDGDDAQTVRVVSAKGLPPPQTSGASSVFAVGLAAKTRIRTPMDLSAIQVAVGVPLPSVRTGVGSQYAALWARMPAGSMVELPDRQAHGLAAFLKKAGGAYAVRRLSPGVKGVWRTE